MKDIKTYTEMSKLKTFKERLNYLRTNSTIGSETFGHDRYLNQALYSSKEWKDVRTRVILRDQGKDLGADDGALLGNLNYGKFRDDTSITVIHHIEPITKEQILSRDPKIFDMDNLVSCSSKTHKLIHYAYEDEVDKMLNIERSANDTCPWKKGGDN